jgi:hypothetical protein
MVAVSVAVAVAVSVAVAVAVAVGTVVISDQFRRRLLDGRGPRTQSRFRDRKRSSSMAPAIREQICDSRRLT